MPPGFPIFINPRSSRSILKKRGTEAFAVKVTSQGKNLPRGVVLVTFFVSLNMIENMRSERAEGKSLRS